MDGLVFILEQNGYICSKQPENPPPYLMFMKGYTLQGFAEKVFHLHVRYGGDWDELYFRDYLRLHPDISQQYGILKSEIQQRIEHDRDGYTYAKTDFIKRYTQLAKSELGVMLNSKNNKCIKMIQLREISQTRPEEIQRLANNHAIAVNLRDTFPYPYTLEDAVTYLDLVVKGELGHVFGIYKDDTFVGCCSVIPQYDIYRINAEIGYWIGEPYWGKGYATEAVKLSVEYAFKELDLLRVYAYIFEYNTASMRVLEKASFEKEAIIKSSTAGRYPTTHTAKVRSVPQSSLPVAQYRQSRQ